MQSPLYQESPDVYYADFDMDDAPKGFEDSFHESIALKRFQEGRLYGELGSPIMDNFNNNPSAWARRILNIEERNICSHMTLCQLDTAGNYMRIYVRPTGPLGPYLERALKSGVRFAVEFRTHKRPDPDDEDEQLVVNILHADVVQI